MRAEVPTEIMTRDKDIDCDRYTTGGDKNGATASDDERTLKIRIGLVRDRSAPVVAGSGPSMYSTSPLTMI